MCFTRTLPADAACRNGSLSERYWRCRVEQELPVEPLDSKWTTQEFAGVCSALGTLRLCVSYRQDLRWKWSSGIDHASQGSGVVLGSMTDDIEVEEGYVNLLDPPAPTPPPPARVNSSTAEARALATPPMSAKSSPRYGPALDKIAEEPEFSHNGFPAKGYEKRTVEAVTIVPQVARTGRPRSYSNASDASTMSTSSRGPSVPDHTVVLSSTPPFALPASAPPPPGLLSLGPPLGGCGSACSSRSNTPHTSPKLGPQPDPMPLPARAVASAHASGLPSGPSESLRNCTAVEASERPPRPASPTLQQGVFDDLSDIWMNSASERGRRWSLASPRSVDGGSRDGSLKSLHRVRSPPQEPQTEIFYFGMSDEEEDSDEAVDEEAGVSDDVGSLSIHEGEGAFVLGGGSPFDAEELGLVVDKQATPASPPLRCPTAVSPLIAQLNPLLSPVLAPCVNPGFLAQGCMADAGKEGFSHLAAKAATDRRLSTSSRGSGCSSPAIGTASCHIGKDQPETGDSRDQRLLGEMGELMVKLQHSPELQIASQEIDVTELMERLEHFREVAGSAMIRRDM